MNKIYLIGDSTCQRNFDDTYPQTGWGQLFNEYISPKYKVINLAKNGRSSKSFYNEGLFKYCEDTIENGDFLFIQFGHNDEKEDIERHTDPFTTYQEQLSYYIDYALKKGAKPVLISSIYRRKFIDEHTLDPICHYDYPKAMEELAKKKNIIYIDMTSISKKALEEIGEKKSRDYFMNFDKDIYPNYPEGKEDNTHLREKGARLICELLVNEIKKIDLLKEII